MALEDRSGKVLIKLKEYQGMLLIEHNSVELSLSTPSKPMRRTEKQPSSLGTQDLWHKRLSHVSMGAVAHLPHTVAGVRIVNPSEMAHPGDAIGLCKACKPTKLKNPISRRSRERGVKPSQVISVVLIHVTNEPYNNDKYIMHAIDDAMQTHIAISAFSRTDLANFAKEMVAYV